MKDTNKLNPEIRFSGFTDDWEQRKLGEIAERVQGNDGRMDLPTLTISAANGWMDQKERFSGNIAGKEQKKYTLLHKGELSYNHGNSKLAKYGTVFSLETYEEALVPRVYHSFKVINGSSKFIEYYFATKIPDRELAKLVSSGARMDGLLNINFNEFMGINLTVPNKSEQEKISNYFSNLDHLITLHQRKLNGLKNVKKAMLEKMFPKNGESVPEIRFSGFTDDWEQRKLNEVSNIYDGTHQTPKYQDDGVMFLSVENIKTLTSNKFISREAFEDEFKIRPQRGDVLMTRIGDIGTANVVETDEDLAYYVSLALFKSEELNPYFLQASIYAPFVQDQIWERTLHIAFPKKINKNEIGQVPINVPTLEEQTKIGSFFKQLDDTITLHQRKLDKLKTVKKAMLEKMFI